MSFNRGGGPISSNDSKKSSDSSRLFQPAPQEEAIKLHTIMFTGIFFLKPAPLECWNKDEKISIPARLKYFTEATEVIDLNKDNIRFWSVEKGAAQFSSSEAINVEIFEPERLKQSLVKLDLNLKDDELMSIYSGFRGVRSSPTPMDIAEIRPFKKLPLLNPLRCYPWEVLSKYMPIPAQQPEINQASLGFKI
jgi:hypothetical protein